MRNWRMPRSLRGFPWAAEQRKRQEVQHLLEVAAVRGRGLLCWSDKAGAEHVDAGRVGPPLQMTSPAACGMKEGIA